MADVVAFFEKIITSNLITKKMFCFQTNWFFEKRPFLKNLKKFMVLASSITQISGI